MSVIRYPFNGLFFLPLTYDDVLTVMNGVDSHKEVSMRVGYDLWVNLNSKQG